MIPGAVFLLIEKKVLSLQAEFVKTVKIMTAIIGFVALVAVALIGWAIAELKTKSINYVTDDEEQAVLDKNRQQLEQNGYTELNISDVIRTIATTGYSAV